MGLVDILGYSKAVHYLIYILWDNWESPWQTFVRDRDGNRMRDKAQNVSLNFTVEIHVGVFTI